MFRLLGLPPIRSKLFWSRYKSYKRRLVGAGYNPESLRKALHFVEHFGYWLEQEGQSLAHVNDAVLHEFERHLLCCQCSRVTRSRMRVVSHLRRFLRHLQGNERVRWRAPSRRRPALVEAFLEWMKVHREVVDTTLQSYGRNVTALVEALGDDPSRYTAAGLRQFFTAHCQGFRVKTAQLALVAIRMFLRYLTGERLCPPVLVGAIPSIAGWSHQPLPLGLSGEEIEAVLAACPLDPLGHRDRAMVLLMVRLGLRADDVGKLLLADLKFGEGRLQVSGKGRRISWLPLPQDVGDALLRYLRDGRPKVQDEHVFLRSNAPYTSFATTSDTAGSSISQRSRVVLKRAGIRRRPGGSHVFRHTAACEMLRRGVRLEGIAEILRHRSVNTTSIYAKVDQEFLLTIAQEWPEVL